MAYLAKNFDRLLGTKGFSDLMLNAHFRLYEAYVHNINRLILSIAKSDDETPEFADMKRRFAWEFNGMRLHEAYFGNLSKRSTDPDPKSLLAAQILKSFGSFAAWEKDFRAVSAMRGIGWAVLAWDPEGKNLFNLWVNEHDVGILYYSVALLVNDVFEHAYAADYGSDRKGYIEAFMNAVNWTVVEKRFAEAS